MQITLKIDGMMRGMCESHVGDAIRRTFPVKKVASSHKRAETVILTEADISEEKLHEAVEATGYRVLAVSKERYEKKGLFDSRYKPAISRRCPLYAQDTAPAAIPGPGAHRPGQYSGHRWPPHPRSAG